MLPTDPAELRAIAGRLVDPIHREVAANVRRLGPASRQDVTDLVQDVLLLLLDRDCRELRRWDPDRGRNLESFVRLVARRHVARAARRTRKMGQVAELPEVADHRPGRRMQARHLLDQVLFSLAGHPRDQNLFDLIFVQELEPTAVAARMGMTRNAVNAWTYRRRQSARQLLAA